jgi:hypothetical protein
LGCANERIKEATKRRGTMPPGSSPKNLLAYDLAMNIASEGDGCLSRCAGQLHTKTKLVPV